jgi:uncharacterized protein YuzE
MGGVTRIKVSPGGEDECILEMDVLWEIGKEGVVIGVECPGPNFKVQVCPIGKRRVH